MRFQFTSRPRSKVTLGAIAAVFTLGGAGRVVATTIPEVEPNNSKSQAMHVTLAPNDVISGQTTGTSSSPGLGSADYFVITPATALPGIYRYQLTNNSNSESATIRGLTQAAGVIANGSDATVQEGTSAARSRIWYGFGTGGSIYYRITGSGSSTNYALTFSGTTVQPAELIRPLKAGSITISGGDWWLYDASYNALPGVSYESGARTVDLAAGTYFLANSPANLANSLPSTPPAQGSGSGMVLDAAGAVVASHSGAITVAAFITDYLGSQTVSASLGPYEVQWITLVVESDPCCLGPANCQLLSRSACIAASGIPIAAPNCTNPSCPDCIVVDLQPRDGMVLVGASATFRVHASAYSPIAYQWRKNGAIIVGATSSTYAIDPVGVGDVGDYDVVLTAPCGSVTSRTATLRPGCYASAFHSKIDNPNPGPIDRFTNDIALEGNHLILGATLDDPPLGVDAGSAYIFERQSGAWVQQAWLVAPDGVGANPSFLGDQFGASVAINGDTAVVGAIGDVTGSQFGSAYVFTRIGTNWVLDEKLLAPAIYNSGGFGRSVAVDGDTIVVGAPFGTTTNNHSGHVYIYQRGVSGWTLQSRLVQPGGAANFGIDVSLKGDTLIIGADRATVGGVSNVGLAFVFVRSGVTWLQQGRLSPPDVSDSLGFGHSVAFDAETALIGTNSSGLAYTFTRDAGVWTFEARLTPKYASDTTFGEVVSLHDNIAAITALGYGGYVATRTGNAWTMTERVTPAGAASYSVGASIATDGAVLVVGCAIDTSQGIETAGAAYVYDLADGAPVFALPPTPSSQVVCNAGAATLHASAVGAGAVYQWRRGDHNLVDGGNTTGATSPTLTINPFSSDDAATDYNVVVSNSCGSVGSGNVALIYSLDAAASCGGLLAGDANCDGAVNNFDIDFFIYGVIYGPTAPGSASSETPAPEAWLAIGGSEDCWKKRQCWGDLTCEGQLNNFDIDPFVACVLSAPAPGVGCTPCAMQACCYAPGCCVSASPEACALSSGTPQGFGSVCGASTCP